MQTVNIEQQFERVTELWSPRVIGRVNDQYVKVARIQGQLTWHKHDAEDELFLVVRGRLKLQFAGGDVDLRAGEFCVVPRGVMHNPIADDECWIMLVETVTTQHTGDVQTPMTKSIEQQLSGS